MAKLLLNANGKVLMKDDKVFKAPESTLKKLLDNTKNCYYLFYQYKGESVEDLIKYSDTENVTDMYGMFYQCANLTTLPLLDTSNATTTAYMFYNCQKLTTISLLDTSNVTNMSYMFFGCNNLTTLPLLDTSKVTSMESMFSNCRILTTINIISMDKITSSSNFANKCYSLTKLIIRTMTVTPPLNSNSFNNCYHFTGTVNETYNPDGLKDGRIYVPDDMVDSLKEATNWSAYADIIVPLSTLEA